MELIPSFKVDHTKLIPGIYESRVDIIDNNYVTTFDIRMKRPNIEPCVEPAAMHTIEHIIATFLRSDDEWKEKIVYWGPMGCMTGSYLIVKGRPTSKEILPLMIRAFEYAANFEGDIPGATAESCGNYKFQDLDKAKEEAGIYLEVLKTNPGLRYQ